METRLSKPTIEAVTSNKDGNASKTMVIYWTDSKKTEISMI